MNPPIWSKELPMKNFHSYACILFMFLAACLLAPLGSFAAEQLTIEQRLAKLEAAAQAPALNMGDNAWMLASSSLVLMMTAPGLILFYGGLVRSKNVLGTMMHSLVLMGVVSVLWMI